VSIPRESGAVVAQPTQGLEIVEEFGTEIGVFLVMDVEWSLVPWAAGELALAPITGAREDATPDAPPFRRLEILQIRGLHLGLPGADLNHRRRRRRKGLDVDEDFTYIFRPVFAPFY
jgi:hypothetical protein